MMKLPFIRRKREAPAAEVQGTLYRTNYITMWHLYYSAMDAVEEFIAAFEDGRHDEDMLYDAISRIHEFGNMATANIHLRIPYHTLCDNIEAARKRNPEVYSVFKSVNSSGYTPW